MPVWLVKGLRKRLLEILPHTRYSTLSKLAGHLLTEYEAEARERLEAGLSLKTWRRKRKKVAK